MKKLVTGGLAALTLGGAVLGAGATASAHDWDDGPGAAVAAGIAGLAVGAALAGGPNDYYAGPAYYPGPAYYAGPTYYAPPRYYYGPPPGYYAGPAYYSYWHGCRIHWRWNHRWGRYVRVRACY